MTGIPPDFDFRTYGHPNFNPELGRADITSPDDLLKHWLTYGQYEKRIYKAPDPAQPLWLLPRGFEWTEYALYNEELKLSSKSQAINHWLNHGRRENRKYRGEEEVPNEVGHTLILILSHDGGGGLSKYCVDMVNLALAQHADDDEVDILVNEDHFEKHERVQYYTSQYLMSLLQTPAQLRVYQKIILHINVLSRYYYLYSLTELQDIISTVRSVPSSKIIFTIHDFNWLWYNMSAVPVQKFADSTVSAEKIAQLNAVFNSADQVIFAVNIQQQLYAQKGISLNNSLVIPHPDYVTKIEPYFQAIDYATPLRIVYLGTLSEIKGYNYVLNMLSQISTHEHSTRLYDAIEVHFYGDGKIQYLALPSNIRCVYHGAYSNDNIFEKINKLKPHLFLLCSTVYESWSYVASLMLCTGLPILYREEVYRERMAGKHNAYPYQLETFGATLIETLVAIRNGKTGISNATSPYKTSGISNATSVFKTSGISNTTSVFKTLPRHPQLQVPEFYQTLYK